MNTTVLSDEHLLAQFEDATLPGDQFHHADHVRAAWLFVRRDGMPRALMSFSAALQRFADAKGAPQLYHVTITWAYLLLVAARQRACEAEDWDRFADANADLLTWKPSILDDFYTPETLWSDFARATFVMPDRIASRGRGTGDAANQP